MKVGVEEIPARLTTLKNKSFTVTPLSRGLTNANYRVDVEGASYVVRVPGAKTELLAVDRANEVYNTRAATKMDAPEFRDWLNVV